MRGPGRHGSVASVAEGFSVEESRRELDHHAESPAIKGRHGRVLQISEAIVLALVTLTAAWSGFSAAKWSTESRLDLAALVTVRCRP